MRKEFEKSKSLFNVDKDLVIKCIEDFYAFDEESDMLARDNKTINDFLAELPEGSHTVIEMADLDRL